MIINGVASEYEMPHSGVSNGAASEYDMIPTNVPNDVNDEYLFAINKITDVDKSGRIPMPPITDAPAQYLYRITCDSCGSEFFTSERYPKVCPVCEHRFPEIGHGLPSLLNELVAKQYYQKGYDDGFKEGYQKGNFSLLTDLADWISDKEKQK